MDKEYQSEEEFLQDYDASQFEKLSMTADILLLSVSDGEQENYRKLKEKHYSVLLVKRENYPFKGKWCLPGGFLSMTETLDEAASSILARETNLHSIYMEQLYTYSAVNRDPRMRIVSTAYMALVDKKRLTDQLYPNASWFTIKILEDEGSMQVSLSNGIEHFSFTGSKKEKEKATDQYEYSIIQNDHLAFDHALVIAMGLHRLKNKVEYTDLVFHMMPEYFTLGELQQVYEVILGHKLLDPAFRRIIASKVEKTTKVRTGGGHRPSYLFRYKRHEDR